MVESYEHLMGSPIAHPEFDSHNFQDRVQLAGDVVSLPITPSPEAGKPTLSELRQGQIEANSPGSKVTNHPSREKWQERIKLRM